MKQLSALLLAVLIMYGCQTSTEPSSAPDSIIVAGALANADGKEISLNSREGSDGTDVTVENGKFRAEVPLITAGYVDYYINRSGAVLYAAPGDSIYITADSEALDSTLTYTGDHSDINNFLATKARYMATNKVEMDELYNQDYDGFLKTLKDQQAGLTQFYAKAATGVDADFVALDKKMENLSSLVTQSNYKSFFEYFNKDKKAEIPEDAADWTEMVDLDDADLAKSGQFGSMIGNLLGAQEPKIDYYSSGAEVYFRELFSRASQLKNPTLREAASFSALRDFISFGGGLDNVTTEIDDYRAMSPTVHHLASIDQLVDKWGPLKRGNEAPTFSAQYADGSPFAIEDLRGKNVYVDVWATWCGPCKKEIPYLKEVEKEYHGKNIEFVSISIDEEKSSDKWKDFVKKEELGGIQVHAPTAWQSDVVKNYKIAGIPRFLLIDAKGNIVSANAPRPSMPQLKGMLDGLMTKG